MNPDEIKKDIKDFGDLESVANTEGGKILIESNLSDAARIMETLANSYSTLSHIQMMAMCAEFKTKFDMVKALTRAELNKNLAVEALKGVLKNQGT